MAERHRAAVTLRALVGGLLAVAGAMAMMGESRATGPAAAASAEAAEADAARALLRGMLEVARLPAIGDRAAVERIFGVTLAPIPREPPNNYAADLIGPGVRARLYFFHNPARPPDEHDNVSSLRVVPTEPCITPDLAREVLGTVYLETSMAMRQGSAVPEIEVFYIFADRPPRTLSLGFLGRRCTPYLFLREGGDWSRRIVELARLRGVWP